MYTDPIADMLTRIRNASSSRKADLAMPHSKLKENLARLLLAEGFISGVQVVGTTKKLLQVTLKYIDGQSVINGIKRVSKPGQRIYVPSDRLPHTSSGFGLSIVSTSQGLLTDKQARKAKVGGEIMCQVW